MAIDARRIGLERHSGGLQVLHGLRPSTVSEPREAPLIGEGFATRACPSFKAEQEG